MLPSSVGGEPLRETGSARGRCVRTISYSVAFSETTRQEPRGFSLGPDARPGKGSSCCGSPAASPLCDHDLRFRAGADSVECQVQLFNRLACRRRLVGEPKTARGRRRNTSLTASGRSQLPSGWWRPRGPRRSTGASVQGSSRSGSTTPRLPSHALWSSPLPPGCAGARRSASQCWGRIVTRTPSRDGRSGSA